MKKISAIILMCIFILSNATIVSADPIFDPNLHVYETSGGSSYSLDDFDIYMEDFEDVTVESEQDLIDYLYEIGMQRLNDVIEDFDTITKLNTAELEVIIRYVLNMISENWNVDAISDSKFIADEYTLFYYNSNEDDDKCNAFRHGFWTMYLCQHASPAFALEFTTAHEDKEDNDEFSMNMDLHNNSVSYNYFNANLINNTYTDDELAQLVKDKIDNGDYIYLKKNYNYVTKITYLPSSSTPRYEYARGNFYVYTNSEIPYDLPEPEIVYLPYLPLDPWDQVVRPNYMEENENT